MNLPAPTSRLDAFVDSASRALIRWRLPLSMIFLAITVALGAMPIALWADRRSRVKSIVIMATLWSVATISCMFTRAPSPAPTASSST